MLREDIKPGRTYVSRGGSLWYVQHIFGQKVIYNRVGDVDRHESSVGRFAARMHNQVETQ